MQITEHFIDFQDQKIYSKQWQPKNSEHLAPIVLLHDSLGCVALWRDFPEILAQAIGRSVIAYDRWGFGQSSKRHDPIDLHFISLEATEGFQAVISYFGLDQYYLLGHSVGGGMAICAAQQYPSQCLGVISVAAQAFVEKKTTDGVREAKEMFKDPVQLQRLAKYHGEGAKWVLEAWTETWLSEPYQTWTIQPNIKEMKCPLLALHGELDEYGSVEQPKHMVDAATSDASFHILKGIGHVPHRENPQELARLVAEFLKERQ